VSRQREEIHQKRSGQKSKKHGLGKEGKYSTIDQLEGNSARGPQKEQRGNVKKAVRFHGGTRGLMKTDGKEKGRERVSKKAKEHTGGGV